MNVEIVSKNKSNKKKPFLGGYRDKRDGKEFHHAATQTVRISRAREKDSQVSVRLQASAMGNKFAQTDCERGTQTDLREDAEGRHLGDEKGEKVIWPSEGGYVTAEEWKKETSPKAVLIQRAFRRWLTARSVVRAEMALLEAIEQDGEADQDTDEENGDSSANKMEHKETEKEAYQRMLAELESRQEEDASLAAPRDEGEADRRRRLAREAAEEARRRAVTEDMRRREASGRRERMTERVVIKAGQPKVWSCSSASRFSSYSSSRQRNTIKVETEGTRRAKQMADAYLGLKETSDSAEFFEDRARAIKAALDVLEEFPDSPKKRDLLHLLSRESDLVARDVLPRNLSGLRDRIASGFLAMVRNPELNPEIAKYEKILPSKLLLSAPRPSKSHSTPTEQCSGCQRHLSRSRFPLSSTSSSSDLRKCHRCVRMGNNSVERATNTAANVDPQSEGDETVFKRMFEDVKREEEEKGNVTSPAFQLQESDIKYVARQLWSGQSVLSGDTTAKTDDKTNNNRSKKPLKLTRWHPEKEWSPWNCALMTETEAQLHRQVGLGAYGSLLSDKVAHRHTMARNHFANKSTMANYFAKSEK